MNYGLALDYLYNSLAFTSFGSQGVGGIGKDCIIQDASS
jgi:hypothetical protein